MKIYGSTNDYYDSSLAYGADPLTIWNRTFTKYNISRRRMGYYQIDDNIESVNNNKFHLPVNMFKTHWQDDDYKLERTSCHKIAGIGERKHECQEGFVFFCGVTYPLIKLFDVYNTPITTIYSLESYEKWLSVNNYKTANAMNKSVGYRNTLKQQLTKHFAQTYNCEALHRINNVAVYTLVGDELCEGGSLKEVEFVKVLDPYTCFQTIEQYLGGVLGGMSPKMIETSDEVRLLSHGFDKRVSFRHRK